MPNSVPHILVIDDQFGWSLESRRDLCLSFGIADETGDDIRPEIINNAVARARYCSGQLRGNNTLENSLPTIMAAVKKGWPHSSGWRWALILLDIRFVSGTLGPEGVSEGKPGDSEFGIQALKALMEFDSDLPVVVLSSRDRGAVIEDCRRAGALGFIQRVQYETDEQSPRKALVENIELNGLISDNRILLDENNRIVGSSLAIAKTLRAARRAATGTGNVLLLGETGTGKELLARYIHDVSPKSAGPYIVFHPFGSATDLQEDELFGHVKGAFTGAVSDRRGQFELANGGTLLIDEIGDIPDNLQKKLLRPIENRTICQQGSSNELQLELAMILATNKNLYDYVSMGRFEQDLLNRISAFPIRIPTLRERLDDMPDLVYCLLDRICLKSGSRWPRKVLPETLAELRQMDWPDHIRGLRNTLEQAVKNNRDSELLLPDDIRDTMGRLETKALVQHKTQSLRIDGGDLQGLIQSISEFQVPDSYDELQGCLSVVKEAMGDLLIRLLRACIDVTRHRSPGRIQNGDVNLAGAVSCMAGKRLTTSQAADLVKQLSKLDESVAEAWSLLDRELGSIIKDAIRLRTRRKNTTKRSDSD